MLRSLSSSSSRDRSRTVSTSTNEWSSSGVASNVGRSSCMERPGSKPPATGWCCVGTVCNAASPSGCSGMPGDSGGSRLLDRRAVCLRVLSKPRWRPGCSCLPRCPPTGTRLWSPRTGPDGATTLPLGLGARSRGTGTSVCARNARKSVWTERKAVIEVATEAEPAPDRLTAAARASARESGASGTECSCGSARGVDTVCEMQHTRETTWGGRMEGRTEGGGKITVDRVLSFPCPMPCREPST